MLKGFGTFIHNFSFFLAAAALLKKFNIFPVLSAVSMVLFSFSP